MSGKAGVGKVLDEDRAQISADLPAEPEQLTLAGVGEAEKRGRGRPEGRLSRRTDETVRLLRSYGSGPLIGAAKIVNSIRFFGPEAGDRAGLPDFRPLALALGMKVAEAAQYWRQISFDLAPYMEQKLPIALDVTGESAGSLVVVNLGAVQGDPETDLGDLLGGHLGEVIDGEVTPPDSEENQ